MWRRVSDGMIRKTLTVLSLIDLVLSVGLWGASHREPRYHADESSLPHYSCRETIRVP